MKILYLAQLLPYPPHNGGKLKTYHLLKLLAQKHQIHLVTFHDRRQLSPYVKKLAKKLNIKVKSFYNPVVTAPSKKIKLIAIRSLFSLKPFRVFKYFSPKMANYLTNISQKNSFDLIHLDHNTALQYLNFIYRRQATVVYDEADINSLAMYRLAKFPRKNFFMRFFMLYDALKNYFYEKRLVKSVNYIFTVSNHDKKILLKRGAQPDRIFTLPISFKTNNLFTPFQKQPTILIVGLMSWSPNKMGILWFVNQVYPIIKQKLPKIKLLIVGAQPEKEILALQKDPTITVTGEVPSIKPFYQQANLMVAPILFGSGIRVKILHSLAAGVPVVSTPIGAEGIKPTQNNGIVISKTKPSLMAKKIIQIIQQPKLAQQLSLKGISFIKTYYSNSSAQKILKKVQPKQSRPL